MTRINLIAVILITILIGLIMSALSFAQIAEDPDPGTPPSDVQIGNWSFGYDIPVSGIKMGRPGKGLVMDAELNAAVGMSLMLRRHRQGREIVGIGPGLFLENTGDDAIRAVPSLNISVLRWAGAAFSYEGVRLYGNLPWGK
jgi:hypothetical protein